MKGLIISVFLIITLGLFSAEPLKIGVITDTHYLSEKLMDDGYAVQDYILSSGRNIKDVPAVLDQVLDKYLNSDIEILLICGDLTKDGEKQSHIDFAEKLKPLKDKGVNVFVIPGNHDINMPTSVEFKGNKKLPVDNISTTEFENIYADYGFNKAIERDTASLSYVVPLDSHTWLLAIDAARYNEYKTSSITAGRIKPETEKWIVEVLDNARQKNIQVVGMMHWGLAEHIMYQSVFFKDYLVNDWVRLADLFADKGMKAIFTGHFHSNDITRHVSQAGNKIYDIETGTLSGYPYAYRFVDLYADGMTIKTENVISVPSNPNMAVEDKHRIQALSQRMAKNKLQGLGYDMPADILDQMADVMSRIFVLHLFGDEVADERLKTSIGKLAKIMDSPIDIEEIQLDFEPADNNVQITF
ncbi:metallophosphoesterase [Dysgonomonas sp. BGC7]|uniref:metallophosphoesterase family protein n=1 Tax=Dysgonomonas sp. BGC7 TaxID=1658008 RepID=UPI00068242BA|nr:metallophosphoesterase [Dysgonomonas sp. BGC7]MBD8389457.1 metallophosphoesterase [Dysgonomonas sp. BGC7]